VPRHQIQPPYIKRHHRISDSAFDTSPYISGPLSLARFHLLVPPARIHRPAQQRRVGSGETIGRHLFTRLLLSVRT